jgi:hypothetical protein
MDMQIVEQFEGFNAVVFYVMLHKIVCTPTELSNDVGNAGGTK